MPAGGLHAGPADPAPSLRARVALPLSGHRLYVSRTTYDHEAFRDNLRLDDADDYSLLGGILPGKRETHRLGRKRCEDALT